MKNLLSLFFFVTILLFGNTAKGQFSNQGYSVGLKVGPGAFDGIYLEGIDLNFTTAKFIYSAGYNYNAELQILNPEPREYFRQANLLFGSLVAKKSFRFEYQGGLGVVWGVRRTTLKSSGFLVDNYNSKEFRTMSLPLKGSIKYVPFQFMSIGLDVLVNINPEKTFTVPMLTLNFGRMMNK